jgi:DNA replication protein DnaC
MTLSEQALDALLKRLHLANMRRAWRELTRRAEQEEWSYRDFLALLISEEIAHRQQTRWHRLVRRARFPFLKTIDDFNFIHQSTLRLSLLGSALAPEFVTEGRCLILGENLDAAKRISRSRLRIGRFRMASMRSS